MSVPAIGDLFFSDLLSELNIKPWWEKFRGYCFAASVASALFMTSIIQPSPTTINCTPLIKENVSSILESCSTQAFFINNYCSNQIPWYVNYAGMIPLMCTILILVASIWWLQIPEIIDTFRAFSEVFENTIPSIPTEQGGFWSEHSYEDGELSNSKKTCNKLLEYKSSIDVDRCYSIRNVVLLFITLQCAVVTSGLVLFLSQDDDNFECSLDTKDERRIFGTTEIMRLHFCSYNTSKKLALLMCFVSLSLFAQVFFILINIYETYSNKFDVEMVHLSVKSSKAYRYSTFMINFWKNARPRKYRSLLKFIEYTFNRALRDMFAQMENAILRPDAHVIRLYSSIKKNGGNEIIKVFNTMMQRDSSNWNFDDYNNVVNAIGQLDSIEWGYDTKIFIYYLFIKKYWRLFVHVLFVERWTGLESFKEKSTFESFMRKLNINTDEIGVSHLDSHRQRPSILHYVMMDKLQYLNMAPQYKNCLKKYVHFDGESMSVSEVSKKYCISKNPRIKQKFSFPVEVFFECTDCSKNSMKAIASLFDKHKRETERLRNQPDQEEYFKYQKEFAEKLSCFKFPKWNSDTKKFAKFLHLKKQWVVFVELLNAFIDPPYANKSPVSSPIDFDCGVDSFILTDKDVNGASILYYALDNPIYLNLRQFQFTAIRYILKFTKGQEKVVIYPTKNLHSKKTSAEKYVKELNMDPGQMDVLLRILKKSSGLSPSPVADQPIRGVTIAGTSSAGIFFQKVRPQSSSTTSDCQIDIVDDPQDSTSPLLSNI